VNIPAITPEHLAVEMIQPTSLEGIGPGGETFKQALSNWNSRNYDRAASLYEQAIQKGLSSIAEGAARSNLAQIRLKKHDVDGAVEQFLRVMTLKQATYDSVNDATQHLGIILSEIGRTEEADMLEQLAARAQARLGYSLRADARENLRKEVRQHLATEIKGSTVMAEQVVDVESDSLEEVRKQLRLRTPNGCHMHSETVVSDGKPRTARAAAETTQAAFADAEKQIPSGAIVLEKRELAAAQRHRPVLDAFEPQGARDLLGKLYPSPAMINRIELTKPGKRGIFGIGRTPGQYEAEVWQPAVVEILYKTMARMTAKIAPNKNATPTRKMEPTGKPPKSGMPPDARAIILGVSSPAKAFEAINSLSFARVVGDSVTVAHGVDLDFHLLAKPEGTIICAVGTPTQSQLREFEPLQAFCHPGLDLMDITHTIVGMVKQRGGGNVWVILP